MPNSNNHPIAILGMTCRLPDASTPARFWNNLETGKSSIQEIPVERWPANDYYHPTPGTPGMSVSKWGGFIDGVREFDAAFFDISPEEAAVMDPQHRILLELAYETLESAGYAGDRRKKKQIGVFVGMSQNGSVAKNSA